MEKKSAKVARWVLVFLVFLSSGGGPVRQLAERLRVSTSSRSALFTDTASGKISCRPGLMST